MFDIPVVFITYIRLDTTKQVFEQIRAVKPTKLYHISDAANDEEKQSRVEAVREFVRNGIDWECELVTNYAEKNMGSKNRINSGLNWVFEREDRAVILEDDVVPSQSFFSFCKVMLERYENDERVMMITGHKRVPEYEIAQDYIFSDYCSIWGWATWSRAWKRNDQSLALWPEAKKTHFLRKVYGMDVEMALTRNLDEVYAGELDAWDYGWQLNKALCGGVEIVPKYNLVKNIGMLSEDATHKFKREIEMRINEFSLSEKPINEVKVEIDYDKMLAKKYFHVSLPEKIIRIIVPASWLKAIRVRLFKR